VSAPLHYLEIAELSKLIQRQEVSCVELTESMLRRIERIDSELSAFATVTAELALKQAKQAQERLSRRAYLGPLHGVPIAVKDLCYTQGVATAAGMPIHQQFVPTFDGTAVKRFREAGAVLLGKLQLTEGAFTEHHPDITLCFGATGSDTGGSIRFPCAANGVTGIKPTWGRVSVYGAFELASSLDHLGPMARSATDCAILLQEMAGADPNDPACSLAPVPNYVLTRVLMRSTSMR